MGDTSNMMALDAVLCLAAVLITAPAVHGVSALDSLNAAFQSDVLVPENELISAEIGTAGKEGLAVDSLVETSVKSDACGCTCYNKTHIYDNDLYMCFKDGTSDDPHATGDHNYGCDQDEGHSCFFDGSYCYDGGSWADGKDSASRGDNYGCSEADSRGPCCA